MWRKVALASAAIIIMLSLCFAGLSQAGHKGEGGEDEPSETGHKHHDKHHKDKGHGQAEEEARERFEGPFFEHRNAGILRDYYSSEQLEHLPPGLRKHVERTGHLPPGLEKHLARTGQLPPGLQKDLVPVSPDLVRRLGPLPPRTRLYLYNRDILLLNEHTNAVVDILHDVVRGR